MPVKRYKAIKTTKKAAKVRLKREVVQKLARGRKAAADRMSKKRIPLDEDD